MSCQDTDCHAGFPWWWWAPSLTHRQAIRASDGCTMSRPPPASSSPLRWRRRPGRVLGCPTGPVATWATEGRTRPAISTGSAYVGPTVSACTTLCLCPCSARRSGRRKIVQTRAAGEVDWPGGQHDPGWRISCGPGVQCGHRPAPASAELHPGCTTACSPGTDPTPVRANAVRVGHGGGGTSP